MASDHDTPSETQLWAVLLHLSLFAGYLVPLAGLIAPFVIWQVQKDRIPMIDVHGRIVANAVISYLLYSFIAALLTFVLIGIPLLIVLGIMAVACPIIGAVKASNGEAWRYPLTISFF